MKRIVFLLALLALLGAAFAQDFGPSVTVLAPNPVTLTPGKAASVTVHCRVNDGFHINSNKPNSEILIPTELQLEPPAQVTVSSISYPPGEMLSLPVINEKISVYSGDFQIVAHLLGARNAAPGTYRVNGQLKFQACNDRQCFPPRTTPVHFEVKITGASKK